MLLREVKHFEKYNKVLLFWKIFLVSYRGEEVYLLKITH